MPSKTEPTNKPAPEFVPTKAEDYPIIRTHDVQLPSGARVRLRRASVYALLTAGAIPDDVREILVRSGRIASGATDVPPVTTEENVYVVNYLLAASFVSPKVSLTPEEGHVCLYDMGDDDRLAAMAALGFKE